MSKDGNSTHKIRTVLIVDDDQVFAELLQLEWCARLPEGETLDVDTAETIASAEKIIFQGKKRYDLIIMDACIPGSEPNTILLVTRIITFFDGAVRVIGCSSIQRHGEGLLQAGCHSFFSKKIISNHTHTFFG